MLAMWLSVGSDAGFHFGAESGNYVCLYIHWRPFYSAFAVFNRWCTYNSELCRSEC